MCTGSFMIWGFFFYNYPFEMELILISEFKNIDELKFTVKITRFFFFHLIYENECTKLAPIIVTWNATFAYQMRQTTTTTTNERVKKSNGFIKRQHEWNVNADMQSMIYFSFFSSVFVGNFNVHSKIIVKFRPLLMIIYGVDYCKILTFWLLWQTYITNKEFSI